MASTTIRPNADAAIIPQGSNNPLVILFDGPITEVTVLSISLWDGKSGADAPLKTWTREDISVDGDKAICPLTQRETAAFPVGLLCLEVKALDEAGYTQFWGEIGVRVAQRRDRDIPLTDLEGSE